MQLGDRFRAARERAGLSQGQVAAYAQTGQGYISDIEHDKRWPSTWTLLIKLADKYGVSVDYLVGNTDDPRKPDGRAVSREALQAIELVNSVPAEQREAVLAVLQAVIELVKVGEREHQQSLPEPVLARQGGGVTNFRRAGLGPQQKMTTGNEAAGDDSAQSDGARKDELLALLKRMLSPEDFEYVQSLVAAGLPLTEADINRLLQPGGQEPFGEGFELPDDKGTVS